MEKITLSKIFKAFFWFLIIFFSQSVSPEFLTKQKLFYLLRITQSIQSETIGIAGKPSKIYEWFQEWTELSSVRDLIAYLTSNSPYIRVHAIYALNAKNFDFNSVPEIKNKLLVDTELVELASGCQVWEESVGNLFFVTYKNKASEKQIQEIIENGIKNKLNLEYIHSFLIDSIPNDSMYLDLKNWAKEGNVPAIAALAKFGKKEDLEIVRSLKEKERFYYFQAMKNYHDESYVNELIEYMDSIIHKKHSYNEWGEYYEQVANLHNDISITLIKKAYKETRREDVRQRHMQYIFSAISKYKDGFYDEYLIRLWDTEDLTDSEIALYLYKKNPNKVYKVIQRSLDRAAYFSDPKIDKIFIEICLERKNTPETCLLNGILKSSVHTFQTYAEYGSKFKSPKLSAAFLKRLRNETNGNIIFPILKVLFNYKSQKTNDSIIEIFKLNKENYLEWTRDEFESELKKNYKVQ